MRKKILIGSIIAVTILILASFSSVNARVYKKSDKHLIENICNEYHFSFFGILKKILILYFALNVIFYFWCFLVLIALINNWPPPP